MIAGGKRACFIVFCVSVAYAQQGDVSGELSFIADHNESSSDDNIVDHLDERQNNVKSNVGQLASDVVKEDFEKNQSVDDILLSLLASEARDATSNCFQEEDFAAALDLTQTKSFDEDAESTSEKSSRLTVRMPSVTIPNDDTYLCTAIKLSDYNVNNTLYITEYVPHAVQRVAHHMLLYGCESPGSTTHGTWDCGGMVRNNKKSNFFQAPVCNWGHDIILWAWAQDAQPLHLPKGVGFQVGTGTSVKYLVLQVHFKLKKAANKYGTNKIAATAVATTTPQPNMAGIYLFNSQIGPIPPHSKKDLDVVCRYRGNIEMHPFAFRTHAHALGVKILGYQVRNDVWTLIGEKNPQLPEAFYPVRNKNLVIKKGDWLAARCVMVSHRDRTTNLGSKHTDEMCNFYFMYWTPRNAVHESLATKECANGYSWVHWSNYFTTLPE